jgi:hypothetical protein
MFSQLLGPVSWYVLGYIYPTDILPSMRIASVPSFAPFTRTSAAHYNTTADLSYVPKPQLLQCHPEDKPDWNTAGTSASHISTPHQRAPTAISYPNSLSIKLPMKHEFNPAISTRATFPPMKLPRLFNCGSAGKKSAKRKYKCRLCTPTFIIAESRCEMRTHNEELEHTLVRYACEKPGCLRTFERLDAMKRHMKTHSKI